MSKSMGDLADYLYSGNRSEEGRHEPGHTTTRTGIAAGDSSGGTVMVIMSDDATQPEDGIGRGTAVEIPTAVSVKAGDRVIVTLVGGTLKSPHVSGVIGRGDELASGIQDAIDIADAAKAAADATAQHFWDDAEGAHVTQSEQEEWDASHSGPNTLWNAAGMLFRNGLTNLLAILSGSTPAQRGLAVYDGTGNGADKIVASLTGDAAVIGRTTGQNVEVKSGAVSFRDGLAVVMRVVNLATSAGIDFLSSGFLRGGKSEQLMWLHGNDRVCIGTLSGGNPMYEQVQIGDEGVTFKCQTAGDIQIDLGDGAEGSGGRIVAPKLGDTPTSRIEQVAGRTGYGAPVDITGYGQSSPYTVPSDGIVWAEANWRANAYTQCMILSSAGAELFTVQQASPGTGSNVSTTGQVFAGMRVYVNRNPSVPYGTARFIPYA